ncbi:MAG: 4Fe-4S binding protein [Clostridiaceae bacterium]
MFEMLGNVMKNLVSKPATRMYPVYRRDSFNDTRGCIGINIDSCIFCGLCSRKCPSDAIKVNKNEKTWEMDPFKCVICGACADACPKKSIYLKPQHLSPAYAKQNLICTQQSEEEEKMAQNQ